MFRTINVSGSRQNYISIIFIKKQEINKKTVGYKFLLKNSPLSPGDPGSPSIPGSPLRPRGPGIPMAPGAPTTSSPATPDTAPGGPGWPFKHTNNAMYQFQRALEQNLINTNNVLFD